MKLVIWIVFALGLLVWTGFAWGTAEATRWAGGLIASGHVVDWASQMGTLRWPAWLTFWVDPALIEATIGAVVATLEAARHALPWFGSIAGWLVALLWVVWALGALLWLGLAGGLHLLVSRLRAPRPAAA